ncbi:DUF1616 domain-containing protein [Natrialba sp. SSL1]|uniref:DUF1616 domain-containing protein n=1 Tax=Natrialba sp. SSL1 TaxID=1869245 RepID=UPI0008F867A8|nr:DUF1616 domain-containing protein [Natrialba sp. SSL1]OIB56944.1 hypothetical protein BBD46_14390 [Natrialba sp. SSL1]
MSDTDWWFLDLAVVIATTGALSIGLFTAISGPLRIALALPLVLFLPGYALVSALFPDKADETYQDFDEEKTGLGNPLLLTRGLEPIERGILSVVFSVAIVPAITLFASATPRGVTLDPVLLGVALTTISLSLLAIGTRYRCPPEQRFAPTRTELSVFFPRFRPNTYSETNPRPYNIAIVLALGVLLLSAGFAVANPPQHEGYTEFAVETTEVDGDIETMYDAEYTAGEATSLSVSITNQEHSEQSYTTVAMLERVDESGEPTGEAEQLASTSTTIADGDTAEPTLEFTPSMQGDDLQVTLLLYQGDAPAEPDAESAYRVIELPVVVE